MNGRYLLDTNIVIHFLSGEPSVRDRLAVAEEVFISSIARGELFFGALKSRRTEDNLKRIEEFIAGSAIVDCDADTAREYARIKNQLRATGQLIPENDIWIAAHARQYDLILVTRDDHFERVEKLAREAW